MIICPHNMLRDTPLRVSRSFFYFPKTTRRPSKSSISDMGNGVKAQADMLFFMLKKAYILGT